MNFNEIELAVNTARDNVLNALKSVDYKSKLIQEESVEIPDDTISTVLNSVLENYKLNSVKLIPSGFGVGDELGTFAYGYPRFIDGDIPTDSSGKQLRFMAQINCKELTSLPEYPHNGLLQFWVQGDEHKLFRDIKDPKAYQVIYIENPTTNNIDNVEIDASLYEIKYPGDFPDFRIKDYNFTDNLLFNKTEEEVVSPNSSDLEVLWKLIGIEYEKTTGSPLPNNPRKITDIIFDDKRFNSGWDNRVGGYPYFTQNGPTSRNRDGYALLLQLDSTGDVIWGDNGIANFFISPDDLKRHNFSNVDFYWDCY